MQKIAKVATRAVSLLDLAGRVVKVRDWRHLGIYRTSIEPTVVHVFAGLVRVFFIAELHVRIADQVFVHVLANMELFDFAILFFHFDKELFVGIVEVALQFVQRVLVTLHGRLQTIQRTQIEVSQYDRLTEIRYVVDFCAFCAVSARANFEEKRAVYFVFFCCKYRCQIVSHVVDVPISILSVLTKQALVLAFLERFN